MKQKRLSPIWWIGMLACIPFAFVLIKRNADEVTQKNTITTTSSYQWIKLLDSAPWKKTYNYQLFAIRDTLWCFHPDTVWYSVDAVNWSTSGLSDAVNNQAFLDYVVKNDSVFGFGYFEGNIERYTFQPKVFTTSNLRSWKESASNLPRLFFYHPFVFNNKFWIIGGEEQEVSSEIWSSNDGRNWFKEKTSTALGKRTGSQIVKLRDTLYLLNNDVWRSTDAINWTKVSDAIVPGQTIFGYAALVYNNKIWLLGCNRNGQFTSNVLNSSDGIHWEEQEAPWLPRGGIAATVFKNQIIMTGGKYGGTPNHPEFRYDNDVWVMY